MKKFATTFHYLLTKTKAKKLCFLSSMLGYKYTTDWIKDHVPEAALLIGEYLKIHPEERNLMSEYLKNPDYIFDKAVQKYKQVKLLEDNGFETEELRMMEGLK